MSGSEMTKKRKHYQQVHIASSPVSSGMNPYVALFYAAIEKYGIKLVCECRNENNWLREHSSKIDAIHLHWPEGRWRYGRQHGFSVIHGLVGFWRYLRLARQLGIFIIWTVHNLEHHEGTDWADAFGYRMLASASSVLICHSEGAKEEILARWKPRGKVVVMKHGNYDGVYPKPKDREDVLKRLGLDPKKLAVCCVGNLREYKGFDVAIDAVHKLNGTVQLVIAGNPLEEFDANNLLQKAGGANYIRIILKSIDPQEFSDIVSASEAMLLPYRKITGSGALMASFTLGCGVVVSDLPYFCEMLDGNYYAGRVFKTGSSEALAKTINDYLKVSRKQRSAAARSIADECNWSTVVQPVADVVKKVICPK